MSKIAFKNEGNHKEIFEILELLGGKLPEDISYQFSCYFIDDNGMITGVHTYKDAKDYYKFSSDEWKSKFPVLDWLGTKMRCEYNSSYSGIVDKMKWDEERDTVICHLDKVRSPWFNFTNLIPVEDDNEISYTIPEGYIFHELKDGVIYMKKLKECK